MDLEKLDKMLEDPEFKKDFMALSKEEQDEVFGGGDKIEQKISKRISPVTEAKDAINEIIKNPMLGTTMNPTSAKFISAVANSPRAIIQSSLAAPVYEIARGNIKGVPLAMKQAFTQEKPTQFGDIIRQTGVGGDKHNEWIAATAGLGIEFAALDFGLQKTLSKGIKDIGDLLYSRRPRIMNDTYLKSIAQKAYQSVDEGIEGVGKELAKIYGKHGDDVVDSEKFQKMVEELPNNVKKYVVEEMGLDLKEKLSNVTINGVRKVKQLVGKFANSKDWAKAAKGVDESIAFERIKKSYSGFAGLLDDSLTKSAGKMKARELTKINEKFEMVKNVGDEIKGMVTNKQGIPVKTKPLINMMKDKTEAGGRWLIEQMGEYSDGIKEAAKMANAYTRRQFLEKTAKEAAKIATIGGTIYAARHEIGNVIGGKMRGE